MKFIIVNEDIEICYFPQSRRFFKINSDTKNVLQELDKGTDFDLMKSKYNISLEEYENFKAKISEYSRPHINIEGSCNSKMQKPRHKVLNRLVIHLTNVCNLNCIYCYANGGSYLSREGYVREGDLDLIINRFFSEFDEIKFIQFFGGEPLLDLTLLERACEKITEINKQREYKSSFGVVTNGTIFSEKLIDLVKKYNISVTFSYDGWKSINDITRPFQDGTGSSDIAIENMKKLKTMTNEPSTIEVTYTNVHIKNNISIMDIVEHIKAELPNTGIHLVPVGSEIGTDWYIHDLTCFTESVKKAFQKYIFNKENSYTLIDRLATGLINKDKPYAKNICDAGIGTLSVNIKGDVYPCFMFTDDNNLILGNILDDLDFTDIVKHNTISKINKFSNKSTNEECGKCFANTLCNGCLGLNNYHSDDIYSLSKRLCDMTRDMAEEVIKQFVLKLESYN